MKEEWTFRTRRFQVRYWKTRYLQVAELHHNPPTDWPICVAVETCFNKEVFKLTKRQLVTKCLTDKFVEAFFSEIRQAAD